MTEDGGTAPAAPRTASTKGPAAFRSISEASTEVGVPQHVLRFWETRFAFIRPTKRAGGRRFYRPQDLEVLRGVRRLLQDEGLTIKGVQKLHKEQGLRRLLEAAGVAQAASLAAEAEAAPAASSRPPEPQVATVAPPQDDERDDRTGDLFDAAASQAPSPPPLAAAVAEAADGGEPAPGSPAGTLDAHARHVLAIDARRRLSEVLRDLEITKSAIDDLLAAGG